jgi:hypothetical protein
MVREVAVIAELDQQITHIRDMLAKRKALGPLLPTPKFDALGE